MPNYRLASEIPWDSQVTIQMGTTGTQFSNTVQADTQLVFENGIWKYPRIAGAAGAIQIPLSSGTGRRVGPVRMAAWNLQFGTSAACTVGIFGNPNNTTDAPYPATDAALYAEGDFTMPVGSAIRFSNCWGMYGANTLCSILMPGQRFYLITTGATNPTARLTFVPLYNFPGGL